MTEESMKIYLEYRGWNGKFFLLTRDHTVEITETGEDDLNKKGTLFFYSNQVAMYHPQKEVDEFGRNYIDQVFMALCIRIYNFITFPVPPKVFHSLTTRKDGDLYFVRVRYDDVDLEMEVVEAFHYFSKLLKSKGE